jgi:hypothetical protein
MKLQNVRYWHKADIRTQPGNVRYLGVKRACLFALQMSANDPKRTLATATWRHVRPPFSV